MLCRPLKPWKVQSGTHVILLFGAHDPLQGIIFVPGPDPGSGTCRKPHNLHRRLHTIA